MTEENGNELKFKTVKMIMSSKIGYYIPAYQRGYRWTEQQVDDLLEDINSFDNRDGAWYCLQPIVVKKCDDPGLDTNYEWYEVIDGQQRLTTLFLVCHCYNQLFRSGPMAMKLSEPTFFYKTRKQFMDYLKNLSVSNDSYTSGGNIDFHHARLVFNHIKNWFYDKVNENESEDGFKEAQFIEKFLGSVKVIWYESVEDNPIRVFTRLNVGKIPLTNSELIKALFLNKTNFSSEEVRLRQIEIASSWDRIEATLQNDEFWLFIHEKEYSRPARIDYIFDIIKESDLLGVKAQFGSEEKYEKAVGSDDYATFRYFSLFLGNNPEGKLERCWNKVKDTFLIFKEWFEDCELYHYIGFLVACSWENVRTILDKWLLSPNKTHEEFVDEYLIKCITEKIKEKNLEKLDKQYRYDEADTDLIRYPEKTVCRPLLLLHNIQTVIDQNVLYKEKYERSVFNKFSFNLYKKESWDVEHIDPATPNDFTDEKDQKEYLLNCFLAVDNRLRERIIAFIERGEREEREENTFNDIKGDIDSYLYGNNSDDESLTEKEKNQIWNFVLLDSSTNRSYKNAVFSGKRRVIIGKDRGKAIPLPVLIRKDKEKKKFSVDTGQEEDASSAFVAPVTKSVFLKYYTPFNTNPNKWTRADADAYKTEIKRTLSRFIKED